MCLQGRERYDQVLAVIGVLLHCDLRAEMHSEELSRVGLKQLSLLVLSLQRLAEPNFLAIFCCESTDRGLCRKTGGHLDCYQLRPITRLVNQLMLPAALQ